MSLKDINLIKDQLNSIITAKSYDKPDVARTVIDRLMELDSLELSKELIAESKIGLTVVRLTNKPKDTQLRKMASDLFQKINLISKRPTTPQNMKNAKSENKDFEKEKHQKYFLKPFKQVYKDGYKYTPDEISTEIVNKLAEFEDSSTRFAFLINLITDSSKENAFHFREKLLKGDLSVQEFVDLKKDDVLTAEEEEKRKKINEENMNKAMAPKPPATKSSNYKCPRCHHNNVSFYQLQIRSADEPMTTFFTCGDCSYQWKRN